jgi:hypothetical protein
MAVRFAPGDALTVDKLNNPTAWTDVAFNAGNFIASGSMTWTLTSGDQITFRWRPAGVSGASIVYEFDLCLKTTSVGGTPSNVLGVVLPFTAAEDLLVPALIQDNGSIEVGLLTVAAGTSTANILRPGSANFSAATNTTSIGCQFRMKV